VLGAGLAGAVLLAALAVAQWSKPLDRSLEPPENETGEAKKQWSGRSFAAQTKVDATASASAAAPGFDSERVWSGNDDWEPAVAADPSSSWVYQMTTRYNGPPPCNSCPMPAIVFRSSSNGGQTWNPDQFIAFTSKAQNDPMIEVATDGAIYAVWLDDYRPGIKFIKSTNRGATWSTPIRLTGGGIKPAWSDRPILAISRDGRHVYIAFNASDSWVTASHNFGASFNAPVKTSNDTRYWFQTQGAVAQDGTVVFVATDYSQDYTGDTGIRVIRSTNGGTSYTTTLIDTSKEMPGCAWAAGCYFGFLGPAAGVAVDVTGTMIMAYNSGNAVGAPQRLYVRTSTNAGATWSARTEISDPNPATNNGFPAVAAGPSAGDFRVVWQDTRTGGTSSWNTWLRRTTNGGASWAAALRLSDLGSGAPYKTASGYAFPYGDYLELAVDGFGRNHVIWGEGASYTGPGGTWYASGSN
jgi:hypothetical protein